VAREPSKNRSSTHLAPGDYAGRWDRHFHFEKVEGADALLPGEVIGAIIQFISPILKK